MKRTEQLAGSLRKVIVTGIIIAVFLGVSVIAGNVKLNSVKITFSDNHEITVLTSKTKVSEILADNHIIISPNEEVSPKIDEEITEAKLVKITLKDAEKIEKSEIDPQTESTQIEKITKKYKDVTEKIITIREEIPYKTIRKDVSNKKDRETSNVVIQEGRNGLKETKYKVTYRSGKEISREKLESKVIRKSIDKIIQIQTSRIVSIPTSRSGSRTYSTVNSGLSGRYKVTAYCSCSICCGRYANGITASGTHATPYRTIAAPSTFRFGTKIKMNGQVYVVEDRGGAIQGNRLDLYVGSHQEALRWGVRYVNIQIVK